MHSPPRGVSREWDMRDILRFSDSKTIADYTTAGQRTPMSE